MKNAIAFISLLISILGIICGAIWYVLNFLWNGLIHTEFPLWVLYFIGGFIISILLFIIFREPIDKTLKP
jgi:hypothetical protein